MKKIIIPVAVLVAAGLIGPKFTGNGFNSSLDTLVENVNTNPEFSATIDSRSTNWFSSEAVITVGMSMEAYKDLGLSTEELSELEEGMSFTMNLEAQHGPVLTLNGLGLGLSAFKVTSNEDAFRDYLNYPTENSFYSLLGNVGLFGSISYSDTIPAFTAKPEVSDGNELAFSGWNGEGTSSGSNSVYAGNMEEFTVVGDGNDMKMSGVKANFSTDLPLSQILDTIFYNSESNISFDEISLNIPASEMRFNMQNFVMNFVTVTEQDNAFMDMDVNYSVDAVSAPEFDAKNLIVKTELNNLERVLFETMQNLSSDPSQMQSSMEDLLDNKLLAQLKANPEFNITELSGTINDGVINAKVLSKLKGIEEMPAMLEDPSFWMSKAALDADIKMDKTMAMYIGSQVVASQMAADPSTNGMTDEEIVAIATQQVEGMLGMFAAQGMLVVTEEGGYEMTFKMEDGQALLNGNPMPLPL